MCYTTYINTPFYVSGFLYNLKTHQILLLQSEQKDSLTPLWSMLGGDSQDEEEAPITFQRIIREILNIHLNIEDIHPIYDYFHEIEEKTNYVFYAEVEDSVIFDSKNGCNLSWVTFPDTLKFAFPAYTKQDMIVGERVINLKWRIANNLQ